MWGGVRRYRPGPAREGAHQRAHTNARPRQLAPATQVLLRAPRRRTLWRGSPPLRRREQVPRISPVSPRRREQVRAQLRRRLHHGRLHHGRLHPGLRAASPRAASPRAASPRAASPRAALPGVPPECGGGGGGTHKVARRLARLARPEGACAADHDEGVLGAREGDIETPPVLDEADGRLPTAQSNEGRERRAEGRGRLRKVETG